MKGQSIFLLQLPYKFFADVLKNERSELMQRRLHEILINAFHIPVLKLGIICIHKCIPETEEIIRQSVKASASSGFCLDWNVYRKFSLHNPQFRQIFQIYACF